ncbi:MAG TPA: PAS domain S-box protein [Chthonomonadaceae bacterium]|nr:PAS domain S-box protein [Chthonomonadaceae bacterium]
MDRDMPDISKNKQEPSGEDALASKDEEQRMALLASIVESSDDAIIGKTLDGTITSWNRGAERLYGYTTEEVLGRPISLLVPPDLLGELKAIMERLRRGEPIEHFETVRVAKDGRRIHVALSISPIKDTAGEIVGASTIARDITEQKQMRAMADNRAVVLEAASRVALDILASRTGVEALRHIADAARTLAHARYAALGVARPDGQGLIEFATVGLAPAEETAIGPRPKGAGILGLLLKRTEPLRIDKLSDHPASAGFPAQHPPMQSFLGVPIRRGEVTLGSLYLTDKEGGGSFTEEDEVAVQALGDYAAVAIHNLHMLTRQRALVSGLIAAQEEERRAVAYDLHDGLTQYVMASHAHLEAFKRAHQAGNEDKAARELEQGLRYLKEAVVESRRLVNGLRSLALDDLGLAGAVEQLLADEKVRAGWQEADLVHNIAGRRFDPTLETAAYRVIQEAITNARKHADTSGVRVTLLACQEEQTGVPQLSLEVHDEGKGFVPEEKMGLEGHVGLQGMAERVSLLGGAYAIESAPEAGTVVRATFPLLETVHEEEGDRHA